jgi:PhnB protein
MPTPVRAIPEGFSRATPYLCCQGAAKAIDFYKAAFGATEEMRLAEPDGRIGHAEIRIGAAPIMLADEYPDMGIKSPLSFGGTSVSIHLYVEDVDAVAKSAAAAGAKIVRPAQDQFYGDRSCTLEDPFGHRWMISTHKEDVSSEEMQRRYDKLMQG